MAVGLAALGKDGASVMGAIELEKVNTFFLDSVGRGCWTPRQYRMPTV